MIVLVVALAVVVIVPRIYEHVTGVGVMRSSSNSKNGKPVTKRRPAARAYIIGSNSKTEGQQVEVPIYSVNEIYASVGVSPDDFSRWQNKYGFGTFGRTGEGTLFIPEYPVLSKIAWMGIDPIDLSPTETSMLIEECTKAKDMSVNAAANTELEALIALARKALAVDGAVRFGLP
ncbi:MAG TPA: hypothetical protein VNU92_06810 [Edaphobacter sp.]|nr:hypothetical protein [Edaphobacter sp.]